VHEQDVVPARRWLRGFACELTEQDRRNAGVFTRWSVLWSLGLVASTFALDGGWVPAGAPAVVVALAPNVFGLFALRAFMRFLRETDELQRKIHLEALAAGFGGGVIFMWGYRLLERAGAPQLDTSDGLLAMILVWAAGLWVGMRRYA